ncbi:odorant receptor 13a-like [Zerene cesonia]|uniref:odorant receptor 13a-like n=1 Tax=Zerene cesonia TaxID=33412 RepID=UPI0018E52DE6|nr:odorant receptor 13a-like [Zerene cesonia]
MYLQRFLQKLTNTRALVESSGELETQYFESMYRVIYLEGISFSETNIGYWMYSSTVKALILLLVFSEVWQFVSARLTIDTVIDSTNIIAIQLSAAFKYRSRLVHKNVFRRLASSMNSPNFDLSTDERKKLMEVWQKRNEAHLKLLLALGTCTLIAWYIYPLVDELDYNLMVSVRLPYDYQNSTLYPITYIGLIVVFSYMSYFVMVNDLTIQAHLMHLLCQFAILNDCFRNILKDCVEDCKDMNEMQLFSNNKFKQRFIRRLGNLSEQHKFLLNITSQLREILSRPMLAQMVVSTTLICCIGFQVAISVSVNFTKWVMSLLYLGYNMFVLYILCRWCEELKIQSTAIGDALYFSGWESGITRIPGVRSSMLLILARANKPLVMSAGGMYDLSLEAYATMVKTSYSALTVLLRLR